MRWKIWKKTTDRGCNAPGLAISFAAVAIVIILCFFIVIEIIVVVIIEIVGMVIIRGIKPRWAWLLCAACTEFGRCRWSWWWLRRVALFVRRTGTIRRIRGQRAFICLCVTWICCYCILSKENESYDQENDSNNTNAGSVWIFHDTPFLSPCTEKSRLREPSDSSPKQCQLRE